MATTISNNCWAGSIDLGSNCVDGATDLDGNPCVVGKAPDIGCYECPFGPGLILLFR